MLVIACQPVPGEQRKGEGVESEVAAVLGHPAPVEAHAPTGGGAMARADGGGARRALQGDAGGADGAGHRTPAPTREHVTDRGPERHDRLGAVHHHAYAHPQDRTPAEGDHRAARLRSAPSRLQLGPRSGGREGEAAARSRRADRVRRGQRRGSEQPQVPGGCGEPEQVGRVGESTDHIAVPARRRIDGECS
ncbi:hypothetical protein IHE61_20920 [Streptomyces sp. GKU 257-1]|nr:hypothetical protein [Streptomyces sp. GKU 257-1]